jgi:hypothetical protein
MATDPNSKARRSVQRPSTKSMRHPGIRHDGLNRDSTRSAMERMREVQAGQADGVLDRHR